MILESDANYQVSPTRRWLRIETHQVEFIEQIY